MVPCSQTKFGANANFCPNELRGGGLGCTLGGVPESCGTLGRLAEQGALAGVASPLLSGNGTIMFWLSGGSISSQDLGNASGLVDPSSALVSSFDGEWVTLNQFMGYINSYYAGLGNMSDDERLRLVAHGVYRGAGGIGDWRFIGGWYLGSLAIATPIGVSVARATSLDSVALAVGEGESAGIPLFHTAVGSNGYWISAFGPFGSMTMEESGVWISAGYKWFQFSVPVLSSEAAMAIEGTVVTTCVHGVCQAIWRDWVP